MKQKLSILLIANIACAFLCVPTLANVTVGTNSLAIIWPNESIKKATKHLIQADLTKVFSFAKVLADAFIMPIEDGEGDLCQYPFPTPYSQKLHTVLTLSNSNGIFKIKIHAPLLKSYEKAAALVIKHPLVVESFTNLVSVFNTGTVTNLNMTEKKTVFWTPSSGEISDAKVTEYVTSISTSLLLHTPSILNYDTNIDIEGGTSATLVAFVPVTRRDTGAFVTIYWLIWDNGTAKLYVF